MKYQYYSVIEFDCEEKSYNVIFPDLPGCITYGYSLEEAVRMAQDAAEGYLLVSEDENDVIPEASDFNDLVGSLKENCILQLIFVDTDFVRKKEENRYVNKTLTLPSWLNDLGKQKGVNFSQLLQQALKKELGL